ncbi:hypothetical protein OCF68_24605 [Bacillus cereus]|nr:hypothetical protein [Bacillus cereus]
MKIPKSVIKKLQRINSMVQQSKKLSEEVEEWIESKGYDPHEFRTEGYSVLEMVDYGEASSDKIESLLIKQFEEMDKSKIL